MAEPRTTPPRKPAAKRAPKAAVASYAAAAAAPAAPLAAAPARTDLAARLRRLEWLTLLLCIACFAVVLVCLKVVCKMDRNSREMYAKKIDMHNQLMRARHELALERAEPEAPIVTTRPQPAVLSSVVKFRDAEEDELRANLVAPLMEYYELVSEPWLEAVLIERKNASSRDVNVRLFMDDGTETSYLWPSTHSVDGVWTPDCVQDVADIDVAHPTLCPAGYPVSE